MATMFVFSSVVERIQYLFAQEGIRSQLIPEDDRTRGRLQRLSLLLNDYGARCSNTEDAIFKMEAGKLGETLYRMENLLESHQVGVASRDKICTMRSILKRMSRWVANHNFRAELSILTDQIDHILARFEDYNLVSVSAPETSQRDNVGGPGRTRTRTRVAEYCDDCHRIKTGNKEEELLSALTVGSPRVQVVSICGMPGIGKTAFAKTLYNNLVVSRHFHVSAWITVSQEFRTTDIFLTILSHMRGLDKDLVRRLDEMDLADTVYKFLKRRRWLVVLDDVWSNEVWESIKLVFPDDEIGSRILVTTRNMHVASSMTRQEYIYNMRFLDEDQSWELFKRRTHLTDSELGSERVQLAKQILRQSGGLPLAILVLANIFLNIGSFNEWESQLRCSAVEISETAVFKNVTGLFDLSYNSLRFALKPCLLYMGTFPEDSKIEAETMFQLWIAEGLVSEERCIANGTTRMELAGDYFDDLASSNLVQVPEEEMSTHQSLRYGCLHGLVRDFCILKAEKEGFFEIVKLGHANQPKGSVFRCAIYLDKHEKMDIHPYLRFDLRSLLFFNSYHQSGEDLIRPWAIPDLSNLKWIRILHFEGVDFKGGTLPPGVENLVLLRHLSLKDCHLEKLPPYISNFLFLITLDLRVKKWCKVIIPNVLCKLQKLRYLYLPLKFQTPNHDNLKLDGMEELEILENFDTGVCSAREISNLTRLRHLAVSSEGNLEDLEQIFKCIERNANHLGKTSLDIRNFDSYSEERLSFIEKLFRCRVLHILRLEGRIGKMPELDDTYTGFTEIHLNGSQLEDDPMQTLQEFPHLRILVLECEAYTGKEMNCYGFLELRSLKLSKLYNLESWEVKNCAMPNLSTLTIENCRRMKKLPEELRFINTLRKLKINMMSKEFVGRLRKVDGKGGEGLDKINTNCTIEFGSDNLGPESTDSIMEQNNYFEDKAR